MPKPLTIAEHAARTYGFGTTSVDGSVTILRSRAGSGVVIILDDLGPGLGASCAGFVPGSAVEWIRRECDSSDDVERLRRDVEDAHNAHA